jgi:hypothetical protein
MSADTAKIVLRNGTLRWSSPVLFNDPFDVQFDLHIEYDRQRVAERAMQAIVDGYMGRTPIDPKNDLGILLKFMRDNAPGLTEEKLREKLGPGFFEGMDRAEKLIPETHEKFRAVVADMKLLCLSEVYDSILMWAHYGREHTGAVLELKCVAQLDSAWGAARPVRYEKNMPLLIDEDKLVAMMSGVGVLADDRLFENSVFVKAAEWSYEKEWRLAGFRDKAKLTEDFGFSPEELSGVYLGCRMSDADKKEIIGIVAEGFPNAAVHEGKKSHRRFAVEFTRVLPSFFVHAP